jgi:5-methylcytosine-specific restriction endonuclease McrA
MTRADKTRECNKKWRLANPDKVGKAQKRFRLAHPERVRAWKKRWKLANPEAVREHCRRGNLKRISTPKGKLNQNMASKISRSLQGIKAGRHWESLVGYTVEQLKRHLEKQFQSGMTWDNYGQWHIDHIVPASAFNFIVPEDIDFKNAWNLKNLRPLWAGDNLKKWAKLERPFQPSLNINA